MFCLPKTAWPPDFVILHKNGVYVIPDFLCNAGGVTVSYFEMVQNACFDQWDIDTVQVGS